MLDILADRKFPAGKIYPLASERSVGKEVNYGRKTLIVDDLQDFDFSKVRLGLFSAGAAGSEGEAPRAAEAGCVVVDNTSRFRNEDHIPLVVPEVNPGRIADYKQSGIIANPNCSTIQMVVALKPIYDAVGITRINVATYQAVSGAGRSAVEELVRQTTALLNGRPLEIEGEAKQIAFNAIPQIDRFEENGYTREEMKMVWETQKILEPEIRVNATCVRIPVFYGHSEAVHIETERKITAAEARSLLAGAPGVELMDEQTGGGYPTAVGEAAGTDDVYVGRIREDVSHPQGLNLWVVSDNVRKGAALNSIQIAEILLNYLD